MGEKEFAAVALDSEYENFVVYVVFIYIISFSIISLDANVNLFHRLQIAYLITKKTIKKVFFKYANFADIFSSHLVYKLPEHTEINNHAIKLVNS